MSHLDDQVQRGVCDLEVDLAALQALRNLVRLQMSETAFDNLSDWQRLQASRNRLC